MDVRIKPRRLSGIVMPPPSKSMAHRLIIAAALGAGTSVIHRVDFSQDIEATLQCMRVLGAHWSAVPDGLQIEGIGGIREPFRELPHFDCGESGSTLRFMLPISLTAGRGGVFTGRGRLMERPQQPYFTLFREKQILYEQHDGVLMVQGGLKPGVYSLPGNISSQFFTGLLLALPLLEGPSTLFCTTELESASYVTMTMGVLERAFIATRFSQEDRRFDILPGIYQPFEVTVESDWSQAAFWFAALFLGSQVRIRGMDMGSFQGDKMITNYTKRLSEKGDVIMDLSHCPDLLPPLAVMAAVRQGTTFFRGAARLRLKESDRLSTTAALLTALGGQVEELQSGLIIQGQDELRGGTVDGANDHRIVMAAAVAATRCTRPVIIRGAEAVKKSYPGFWQDYENLGGDVRVV